MAGCNFISRMHYTESCSSHRWIILTFKKYLLPKLLRTASLSVSSASKSESDGITKTYFQELMSSRKEQACRSALFHIPTKNDVPYALAKCEQFGDVVNAYSYLGERNNYFVLLEFSTKDALQDLFKSCQHQHINDSIPLFSRIVQFEKKTKTNLPKVNIEIQEDSRESSLKLGCSISEVIEDIYSNEKLTELDTRLRYFFCTLVKDSASGVFPHCDVFPFGSSVNGLGRRGCDLDTMIKLYPELDSLSKFYPEKENNNGEFIFFNKTCSGQKALQQKVVHFLGDYFYSLSPGTTSVQKILTARMPILKMKHRLLKMDCDVSVNNMSAIFMSDIVHFCGEVDSRFRPLFFTVKKWAKEAEITQEKPGTWITNFGLTTLLIYFLQKVCILPPLNDALVIVGDDDSLNFHLQYLKSIEHWKNFASQNEKSLAELLIEFLLFLEEYQFEENVLSLMSGKERPQSLNAFPMWVQYPFNEGFNVTKNVSEVELVDLCRKAGIAAKSLENKLSQKNYSVKDFSGLFGIQKKQKLKNSVDVSVYFENPNSVKQRTTKHR